jgi:TPR repeat protein
VEPKPTKPSKGLKTIGENQRVEAGAALAFTCGFKKGRTKSIVTPEKSSEVGQQYFFGEGRKKSYKNAFPYLLDAAYAGDAHCQNLVGYAYERGLGTERDLKAAFSWYQFAASNEDIEGLWNLALCYEKGKGVKVNEKRAFSLYRKAAELGDAKAQGAA